MLKVNKTAVLFALIIASISMAAAIAVRSDNSHSSDNISVQIYAPDGAKAKKLEPRLLVLVTNTTNSTVYIDRHLSSPPLELHSSLVAYVTDVKSGKSARLRAFFKRVQRIWKTSDFITLDPGLSYGAVIDLRDYFSLKPGSAYRVRFEYRNIAPKQVGALHPWNKIAVSRTVVIKVPS